MKTDAELLAIVGDEKKRSIGFNINANSYELMADRERALNYIKGNMTDIPSLPNRSSAVSTDVADTIETWLSDMVEILAGGEDVVCFQPNGPQDETQARQETDYINHVFFNENAGFMVLYTMLKDAGQTKTGVVTWWEEDVAPPEPQNYEGLTEAQVGMIATQDTGQYSITSVKPCDEQAPVPLFDVTLEAKPRKRAKVAAVNPSDFSVAADTVGLRDATYCAMKVRPRAQDLIADGIDPDVVDRLPPYSSNNDVENQARDTAGEHASGGSNGGVGDLRQVEIIKHYIRLVDDDRTVRIWCVRTSNDDALLIDKEEVDEIPFAAITPYPVTHRFYGESIADKTMEPQKIRTSLTRMALDSGYFALNQRSEVSETDSSENTIPDLLRNEPGMPVRSKSGNAVRPIQSGSLGFDPFNALEYFATVVESRTGVVRNAQGMNPDTLHDTASGAGMLANAAQKRSKLMARIFAETGIKDLYLGLHALLRRIGGMTDTIRLNGSWVDIDPTAWGQRNDMTVEVGVGSSGRQQDLAAMNLVIQQQAQAVAAQGGVPNGPLVTWANLFASATRLSQKAGIKNPEAYWTDPAQAQQQPPQPDPKAIADAQAQQATAQLGQAKLQLDQQKLALDGQSKQTDAQIDAVKLQLDQRRIDLDEQKLQLQALEVSHRQDIERQKLALDAQHKQDQLDQDSALRIADMNAKYSTSITVAQIKSAAEEFRARADVALKVADHEHDHAMAEHEHGHAMEQAEASRAAQPAPDAEVASEPKDGDQ